MMDKEKQTPFFNVQNEIFNMNLSGNGILVYTYLSKCADCFGKSWPAHKTIAASCSLSVTAVKEALSELKEIKLITLSHQYRPNGGKSSNLYMITNREKKNNFFVDTAVFAKNLSAKAKLIYMYFCRCSNAEGNCFPAHKTIAEKCKMAVSTCRKAIKELLDGALIAIDTRARADNGQTSNLYTLVKATVEKVEQLIERAKGQGHEKEAENMKKMDAESHSKNTEKMSQNHPQSQNSREHSHNIAGGLLKCAYERTKLKLRKYITKEYGKGRFEINLKSKN